MNLTETTQLLNDLESNFRIYTKKDFDFITNDNNVLIVNHKNDTSTVMFYGRNGNYIKTL